MHSALKKDGKAYMNTLGRCEVEREPRASPFCAVLGLVAPD